MSAHLSTTSTRGMVFIHSAAAAVRPHVEWAISAALGSRARLEWTPQSAEPGAFRTESSWSGELGTGARLASQLARLGQIRFEVTEDPSGGSDGQRYAYTPALGPFTAVVGIHGDLMVPEDRLKQAIAAAALGGEPIAEALERLLGTAWDSELEVFRHAGEDAPVRWLHNVG